MKLDTLTEAKKEERKLIAVFWIAICCLFLLLLCGVTSFFNNRQEEIRNTTKTLIETIVSSNSNNLAMEVFLDRVTAYELRIDTIKEKISGIAPNNTICIYNKNNFLLSTEDECNKLDEIAKRHSRIDLPIKDGQVLVGRVSVIYEDLSSLSSMVLAYKLQVFLLVLFFGVICLGTNGFFRIYLKKMFVRLQDAEKEKIKSGLAAELAHDLISPLSAASSIIESDKSMPDSDRHVIRGAMLSIQDIVNKLMDGDKKLKCEDTSSKEKVLLLSVVEDLFSEKRREYCHLPDVRIEVESDECMYGAFVSINYFEFKRAISNLVNNSVRYKNGPVTVTAKLVCDNRLAKITIKDNGKGIPKEILEILGERGITTDLTKGHGFGFYNAKNIIESFGGKIEVKSQLNVGTEITITFTKENPPSWFIPKITLSATSKIVILDDDTSIHMAWARRLATISENIVVQKFSNYEDFRKNLGSMRNALLIVDYELRNDKINGLDIIEKHNLGRNSILVTSKYNDKEVYERCQLLNVSMIPKRLVQNVKIDLVDEQSFRDGILIDDDKYVRASWQIQCDKMNKNVLLFSSIKEFWAISFSLPKDTLIYIDSKLDDDVRGEIVAKDISEAGFENIYLTTGYPASKFEGMNWIKGVLGKEPPWTRQEALQA